jgi:hypothetical protein
LSTRGLLLTLLFAQLSEAGSLRDIEAIIASRDVRRCHSRLPQVCRSTRWRRHRELRRAIG